MGKVLPLVRKKEKPYLDPLEGLDNLRDSLGDSDASYRLGVFIILDNDGNITTSALGDMSDDKLKLLGILDIARQVVLESMQ